MTSFGKVGFASSYWETGLRVQTFMLFTFVCVCVSMLMVPGDIHMRMFNTRIHHSHRNTPLPHAHYTSGTPRSDALRHPHPHHLQPQHDQLALPAPCHT